MKIFCSSKKWVITSFSLVVLSSFTPTYLSGDYSLNSMRIILAGASPHPTPEERKYLQELRRQREEREASEERSRIEEQERNTEEANCAQ